MMRFLSVCLLMTYLLSCEAQNSEIDYKMNDKELENFLIKEGEISEGDKVIIFDDVIFSNSSLEVHKFGPKSSHGDRYLYIIEDQNKTYITDYSFQIICNDLFNRKGFETLLENEQLLILKEIIKVLEEKILIFEQGQ